MLGVSGERARKAALANAGAAVIEWTRRLRRLRRLWAAGVCAGSD
jgi:hypothetical protein